MKAKEEERIAAHPRRTGHSGTAARGHESLRCDQVATSVNILQGY
jgi:hypothetical protein